MASKKEKKKKDKKRRDVDPASLSGQLLNAIESAEASGMTQYAIAKAAGIKPELLYRFVSGERDLKLATAAKITEVLRLQLTPVVEAVVLEDRPLKEAQG
ncbi:helix-turn-helix protein [Planctomycetes bacterium Pan216]|uniref:Helix-turn-helix protein n=1 Tax=Kolteria novifilia TaxID=2527975 RepID=A0A518B897_9BACT|nr:helix-turn-helix protein [Planctomycetes bacterium Pan216]